MKYGTKINENNFIDIVLLYGMLGINVGFS
jgi:hypothetical protein